MNHLVVEVKEEKESIEVKKILVLPSALDKDHPLFIGYVGK